MVICRGVKRNPWFNENEDLWQGCVSTSCEQWAEFIEKIPDYVTVRNWSVSTQLAEGDVKGGSDRLEIGRNLQIGKWEE